MMPNPTRLLPSNWFQPYRESKETTDEVPKMIMQFKVKDKKSDLSMFILFTVVTQGDKAIARTGMVHASDIGFCDGHKTDIAEYPIDKADELCEEVKNHGLMMGSMLAMDPTAPATIDTNEPVIAMIAPAGASKADFINRIVTDTDPRMEIPKQIMAHVLGASMNPRATREMNQATQEVTYGFHATNAAEPIKSPLEIVAKDNETLKRELLAKTALEQELIKKYGKKTIEALAKKIHYKGALINKTKKKSHAKSK